ncbi:MAG: addiction module protein [Fimbriiglobus sp.]
MSASLEQLGIDRLSPAERLELIGLIWDSITESQAPQPSPEWQRREIDRRIAAGDADPAAGIPWEIVHNRLLGRLGVRG